MASSYGTIVIDAQGRVLLRAPTGGFGGAAWTFAKGKPDKGETPEETAKRETLEETGHKVKLIAPVPGEFAGTTGTTSYWIAESVEDTGKFHYETAEIRWVDFEEAEKLLGKSSAAVAARDLKVLTAARDTYNGIQEATKRAAIPPAVQQSMRSLNAQLDKLNPKHAAAITALSKRLISDLNERMGKLAPGKFETTLTASKLLQLQAIVDRSGVEFGNGMGKLLTAQGTEAAKLGREALVSQINAWADTYPGATSHVVSAQFAGALLDPGLLERYEVSRKTYGMDAIARMRQELAYGALNNDSLSTTWKRIAEKVAIPKWRAERIVRTEHSFATHRRQIEDLRNVYGGEPDPKTGVRKVEGWWKELSTYFDNRTGADSVWVHKQRRRIDRPFVRENGQTFMHPPDRPNDRGTMLLVPDKAAPKVRKKQAAPVPPDAPKAWPTNPRTLKVVRQLGGSTGAELVEDETGARYVRKTTSTRLAPDHVRSEFMADELYRAAGVRVPDGKLYEDDKGPVKLTRYLEGTVPLGSLPEEARKRAEAELRKSFVLDATLGNWDVIGQSRDNVLCSPDGTAVYRIDNGGALGYRAQGTRKDAGQFTNEPNDLWSMRNARTAPQAAPVFSPITMNEIADQARHLASIKPALDKVIDDSVKASKGSVAVLGADGAKVSARLRALGEVGDASKAMLDDRFRGPYVDDVMRHRMALRGRLALPRELAGTVTNTTSPLNGITIDYQPVQPKDEHGKLFDELRGQGANQRAFDAYLAEVGAPRMLSEWGGEQAGSSWNSKPTAIKHFVANEARDAAGDDAFWYTNKSAAADAWTRLKQEHGDDRARQTMAAAHAYTQEILSRVNMHPVDRTKGTVRIYRTEPTHVIRAQGFRPDAKKLLEMPRGVAESGSLFKPVSASAGDELTVQDVPIHRVLFTYLGNRPNGLPMFMGDGENEAIVMFDRAIKFRYVGKNPV